MQKKRINISLSEIKHVRVECQNGECRGGTLFSIKLPTEVPDKCPHCGRTWRVLAERIEEMKFILDLRDMISNLETADSAVEIMLEVPDPA